MPPQSSLRARWRRWYRRAADWILRHQGSPYNLAMGFAVGMFVALTPTVGIQMVLGGLVAHFLKGNRAIAAALAWITNPLTMGPIYYFNYRVGLLFLPGDEAAGREFIATMGTAKLSDPHSLWTVTVLMGEQLWGVAGVLWAGSLVVAAVAAILSYGIVWRMVTVEQAKLARLRALPSLPPGEPSKAPAADPKPPTQRANP